MSSKLVILICLAAVLTGGLLYTTMTGPRTHAAVNQKLIETFARWKQLHGRLYASPAENDFRLSVFADQLSFVEKKNREYEAYASVQGQTLSGPMFEMNKFGDLTNEEFAARYLGSISPSEEAVATLAETKVPSPIDARNHISQNNLGQQTPAFVPKLRDQGNCGGCWAFAALVEMERIAYITSSQYIDLSVQELIDCVPQSSGCFGGLSEYAFNYAILYGVGKASDYPFVGANTACVHKWPRISFPNFKWIPAIGQFSITKARRAAADKVMPSVSLNGGGNFRYLSRTDDVYDARLSGECDSRNSHSVAMITAYKDAKGNDVVQILNSWGPYWGVQGYKRFIPCHENSLLGIGATWASPYGY